jgi:hypothetical protein
MLTALWKKGMQEIFLQNLFIYYYWEFKKLVIFHEIVCNITVKKMHPILDAKCNKTKFSMQFH